LLDLQQSHVGREIVCEVNDVDRARDAGGLRRSTDLLVEIDLGPIFDAGQRRPHEDWMSTSTSFGNQLSDMSIG
jgi:hypothetical protein